MRFFALTAAVLALFAAGCAIPKDKDPKVPYVQYRTTNELQGMRITLEERVQDWDAREKAKKKNVSGLNNNRKPLPSLLDEQAAEDRKKLAEIQIELARRYQQGDTKAYYQGMQQVAQPTPNIPDPTTAPAEPLQ